jgi:hypothetical protein
MVDIRTSCYAARLAAFSCPQKHWKALIFRGALTPIQGINKQDSSVAAEVAELIAQIQGEDCSK